MMAERRARCDWPEEGEGPRLRTSRSSLAALWCVAAGIVLPLPLGVSPGGALMTAVAVLFFAAGGGWGLAEAVRSLAAGQSTTAAVSAAALGFGAAGTGLLVLAFEFLPLAGLDRLAEAGY